MATLDIRARLQIKLSRIKARNGKFVAHDLNTIFGIGNTRDEAIEAAARVNSHTDTLLVDSASDGILAWAVDNIEKNGMSVLVVWHGVVLTRSEHDEIVAIIYKNRNRSDEELKTEFNLED